MGDSRIYWTDATGTVQSVDFGVEELKTAQVPVSPRQATSLAGYRALWTGRKRTYVQLKLQPVTDESVRRALSSMMSHLYQGGAVAFAGDPDKVGAAWCAGAPAPGSNTLVLGAYPFDMPASPTVSLPNGTQLVLEGMNAILSKREECNSSGSWSPGSSAVLSIAPSIRYGRSDDTPVLLRTRDYFPRLIMPAEEMRTLFTHRPGRLAYDGQLNLEVDVGGLLDIYESGT